MTAVSMIIKLYIVYDTKMCFQYPSWLPKIHYQNSSKTFGMFRKVSAACVDGKQALHIFQATYRIKFHFIESIFPKQARTRIIIKIIPDNTIEHLLCNDTRHSKEMRSFV